MTARAPHRTVIVLGCAVAAGVALFAVSRVWQVGLAHQVAPLPPAADEVTGSQLVPALPALALVALAGAGGLLATGGLGRRVVAGLVTVAGLLLAGIAAANLDRTGIAIGWVLLTVVAGLGVAASGVLAAISRAAWPGLSGRYSRTMSNRAAADSVSAEQPGGIAQVAGAPDRTGDGSSRALWDSIERGEDPTTH